MIFRIRVVGTLDQSWSDWLGNARMVSEPQKDNSVITSLTVDLADQSALFGILDRIRDLNIALIDVTPVEGLKK